MDETKEPVWAEYPRPVLPENWMQDGNAFWLLGCAAKAQSKAGWPRTASDAWHDEATSSDYDHLLRAIVAWHDMPGGDEYDDSWGTEEAE
jgi:hypothetical protein